MFEVMGAFRHLPGFTSICLLPVTLGFSKIFHPKIVFHVVMVGFDRTRVLVLGIPALVLLSRLAGRMRASPATCVLAKGAII